MRYRPKRENYAVGQFGEIYYQEMIERYCTYLENQNKQLRIGVVSNCECKNLPEGEIAISSKALTDPNWKS